MVDTSICCDLMHLVSEDPDQWVIVASDRSTRGSYSHDAEMLVASIRVHLCGRYDACDCGRGDRTRS
jgi:hypothetical protein